MQSQSAADSPQMSPPDKPWHCLAKRSGRQRRVDELRSVDNQGGRVLGSTRATYRHTNQRNERAEVAGKRNVNTSGGRLTGRQISEAVLPQDEKRKHTDQQTQRPCNANTQISSAIRRAEHCLPCSSWILDSQNFSVEKVKSQLRVMTKMGQLGSTRDGRFGIRWSRPV